MGERTASRRGAAAGAILVVLGVAGLWYLLGDGSEEQGSKSGALSRTEPAAARSTKPAPFPRTPGSGAKAPESASENRPDPRAEGALEVEVFSGDTPLPGAQVHIYEREPADLLAPLKRWSGWNSGETDADGRRVVPAAPGSYYVTARAEGLAPGYAAVVHPPGSARTRVQLHLEAATELRGTTVVKGTGDPVSLAEVLLTPPTFESSARARPEAPEEENQVATSSEAGEFQLSGLTPGRYRVEARAPGYVSAVLPSVPIPFGGRITLELIPAGHLEGVVVQANGEPADGAEVLVIGRDFSATALSDGEGHFTLDVPPGTYAVSARKGEEAGALDREVKLAVGQRVQGLRLQLGAGATVTGKVIWKRGLPIPAAQVEARPAGTAAARGLAETDESGSFALSGLAAGTYNFRVSLPGGGSSEHGPVTLAAGEHSSLTLTYDPHGNLSCNVSNKEGRPVEGILVRVSTLPLQGPGDRSVLEARTTASGSAVFKDLPLGRVQVEAFRDPRSPVVSELAYVSQEGASGCWIRLPGGPDSEGEASVVEGRVVQPSGEAPTAPVFIRATRQKPSPGSGGETVTDVQGRFRLGLLAGQYLLSAIRQQSVRCGGHGQRLLDVEPGQNPEATIPLEPMREPDLRLQVLESNGAPARLAWVRVITSSFWETAQTDEQGRLDVCLPPEARQRPGAPLLLVTSDDGARTAALEQTNGQRDFVLRLVAPPTLRVRLIAPDGAPIRRVAVDLTSPYGWTPPYEFTSDRFTLSAQVGRNELLIFANDTLRASLLLDLRPEERKDLEIAVSPGVTMTGRIVDAATRRPVAGASVWAARLQGADTSEDGRFTLSNVPAGELLLSVYRKGTGPMLLPVKLLPGQANDVGDIPIPAP